MLARQCNLVVVLMYGIGPACEPRGADDDGSAMTSTTTSTAHGHTTQTNEEAWFEIGWGENGYELLVEGGELRAVWGLQGLAMFPLPLRGGGFVLPDDPADYEDERIPLLDLELDIDGFNDGVGGHFRRLANYPVVFRVQADGSYAFDFIPLEIPPDGDIEALEGRSARLWVQLRPYDAEPMTHEYQLTVTVDPAPF